MDNFDLKKYLTESRLSPEKKNRLDYLRDELFSSTDPEREYVDGWEDLRDPDEIINDIRNEFGDVIANQIENGKYEMHYPRDKGVPGFQASDKLADKIKWGVNDYRITKGGKMHKQDVNKMKDYYKKGY